MTTAHTIPADPPELWALWPDDYMCAMTEVDEMLRPPCARSDDFQVVRVLSFLYDGEPESWEKVK